MKQPVYLDYSATTPVDERVLAEMLPYFSQQFGNAASRSHVYGWAADEAVEFARERVAGLIGAHPKEIVFTSGATESVNLAIKGVYEAYRAKGNHIITCTTEHKAVLDTCHHLEKLGAEVTYVPVDAGGRIDPGELERSIRPSTILVAVMLANNETGVLQPVREVAALARRHQVLFFCDATQAAGKIAVDVLENDIPLLCFSAHKIYGPKGVGALYVRRRDPRVQLIAQMDGGGHENRMRSGTLNVPGIVGFGKACEICMHGMESEGSRLHILRDLLETTVITGGHVQVNGNSAHRLPHVTNLSFEGATANALIGALQKKVAVSSGSACTSALAEPSYVLRAMGLSDERAGGSLRFSLGRNTTEPEIQFAVEAVIACISALRGQAAAS